MANLIPIKKHSYSKYAILEGLLTKADIEVYAETHAGTGMVWDIEAGQARDGSLMIAAKSSSLLEIYGVEIDPSRYELVCQYTKSFTNVHCIRGDCNTEVDQLLNNLAGRQALFFVDQRGLIYRRGKVRVYELRWETIQKITQFPNGSLLLTFPILAIFRNAADALKRTGNLSAIQKGQNVSIFFGDEDWQTQIRKVGDYRAWTRYFMNKAFSNYQFKGATLLRNETRAPVLYLIFGSNSRVMAENVRKLMCSEAGQPCKGTFFPLLGDCDTLCSLTGFMFD